MLRAHAVPERVLDSFSGKWTASGINWRVTRAVVAGRPLLSALRPKKRNRVGSLGHSSHDQNNSLHQALLGKR